MNKLILSENSFKNKFKMKKISYEEFKKKAKVNYKTPILLKSLVSKKKITADDMKFIYKTFIENRDNLLKGIYDNNLNLSEFNKKDLKHYKKGKKFLSNKDRKQKNIIKNINFNELYFNTTQGIENSLPNYYIVLKDIYSKLLFDHRLLSNSGLDIMRTSVGSVLSGFYFRASVYNPVMLYWIFDSILKPKKLLTPTLGWCSYLLGALEYKELKEYVGIDVLKSVCDNAKVILKNRKDIKSKIYCKPSESLIKEFKKKYSNNFDTVFFSPPFFNLEIYSGKNQSTSKYPEKEIWLNKYWDKTCELCYNSMIKGGKFTFIISNHSVHKNLRKEMLDISKKYFSYLDIYSISVNKADFVKHTGNVEKLYILIKN